MLLQDLRDDAREFISNDLTAAQYPDVKLDKSLNEWYRTILAWVIPDQGEWEIQGDELVMDLQPGQLDYEIPAGLLRLYKAEIMYINGGTYIAMTPRSEQREQELADGNPTSLTDDPSKPFFEVFGDFIRVRPPLPVGSPVVVNGLKIFAQIDFTDLTDPTNVLPDLNPLVHRCISIGGALDYALKEKMASTIIELKRLIYGDPRVPDDMGYKERIVSLYSIRAGQRRDRIKTRRTNYQ